MFPCITLNIRRIDKIKSSVVSNTHLLNYQIQISCNITDIAGYWVNRHIWPPHFAFILLSSCKEHIKPRDTTLKFHFMKVK